MVYSKNYQANISKSSSSSINNKGDNNKYDYNIIANVNNKCFEFCKIVAI